MTPTRRAAAACALVAALAAGCARATDGDAGVASASRGATEDRADSARATRPPWTPDDVGAGERRASWGSPRIDPRLDALFAHRARSGETFPAFVPDARFEREGVVPVVVRFASAPAPARLAALAAAGVAWGREARALHSGAFAARVHETALRALEAEPSVARVEADLALRAPAPLDAAQVETGVDAARRALRARGDGELDGRGVVIGDIDSALFVFHPALFRADAGLYPWVDVDGDGALTAGVDGVDLDGDGAVAPSERLHVLSAATFGRAGEALGPRPAGFRPDRDWLYLDTDGDGARGYGEGFDEDTPAYGEPLFVADDADGDGRVSPRERLRRLGTSKVRAVLAEREYLRGGAGDQALVRYDPTRVAPFARAQHATAVAGILVGGEPGVSRWLGLAPGAEVLLADHGAAGSMGVASMIQWHLDQGADVLLTEFAPYVNATLDGSSEVEQLLDAAVERADVVAVSPAGNLANAFRHRTLRLEPGANAVAMLTERGFAGVRTAFLSLHHRGAARAIALSLALPGGGAPLTLPDDAPRGQPLAGGALTAYVVRRVSARGTHERHVTLVGRAPLPEGRYTLTLTLEGTGPLELDAYVGDEHMRWTDGLIFERNDGARTLCHPATSDRTLAVGAYVLHRGYAFGALEAVGEVTSYSSRGPRLDGADGIALIAPANPMTLLPVDAPRVPLGAYSPFGGTSGAGPHVAAAAALLRQRDPAAPATALRARLLASARHDAFAPADAPTVSGHGKLTLPAALGLAATPPSGRAPVLTLRAPARAAPGPVRLEPVVDDDEPAAALRVRWDDDYDGRPDTDWLELAPRDVIARARGALDVRVEVRDGQGHLAAQTARIEITDPEPEPPRTDAAPPSDAARGPNAGATGCSCDVQRSATHRAPSSSRLATLAGLAALSAARRRRRRGRCRRARAVRAATACGRTPWARRSP